MRRFILAMALLAACSDEQKDGSQNNDDTTAMPQTDGFVEISQTGPTSVDADSQNDDLHSPDDVAGDPSDTAAGCSDGSYGCLTNTTVSICVDGTWQFNNQCSGSARCVNGACTEPADCDAGAFLGCEGLSSAWVCSLDGKWKIAQPCPLLHQCTDVGCTRVQCTPFSKQCTSNTTYQQCEADGSGWSADNRCQSGTTCVGGNCLSLCEADIKYNTNVGCEYWTVDLNNDPTHHPLFPQNPTPEMFPHSVVISNPGSSDAIVTFTARVSCADGSACSSTKTDCSAESSAVCDTPVDQEYALDLGDTTVPGGDSREFKMPIMNVSGSGITPKAVRITSTLPVIAYQFNPFNSENAASNDGSLLLPQKALGKEYFAVSLPSRPEIADLQGNPLFPANSGLVAIVPTEAATQVAVTPTVEVMANPSLDVPQDGTTPKTLAPGQTYVFTLNPYEVLNLEQLGKTEWVSPGTIPKDLTGTHIVADKPIAVFSGHQVAGVQEQLKLQLTDVWDSCCTEHMEEQLMPVETWGTQALCVKSKPRGSEADRWIIVAGDNGVLVNTVPPIEGINGKILSKAGDYLRVETTETFLVAATGRIQIVQFLMSQGQTQPIGAPPGAGDPTMMIVPPREQYRDEYVIRTADGFNTNWTTVIRPAAIEVQIDGVAIPNGQFVGIGDGSWEYTYVEVATGTHKLSASEPFGLMVYGYGTVTAYGYPGGMKLDQNGP